MGDDNVLGLAGKGALVVGGGFGMGRETALLLARAGANVAVADRDPDRAESVAAEVAAHGVRSRALSGDVTVESDATAVVEQADAFLDGRLEVLINIVGMASWKRIFEMDDETWDRDLTLNLRQHLYVGRAAARRMVDAGIPGRMAFVASVSGLYGAPNHGAYGAAKAGVMALTRTMAQEWGKHGIRVNSVAPDAIDTPRVVAYREAAGQTGADAVASQQKLTLGRMGVPFEIAGPLVFLVSDLAGFITGQNIIVDGGRRAAFPSYDPAM